MFIKMKQIGAVFAALMLLASSVAAETAKTYQVTGPIIELTDKIIAVDKAGERWEIAREPNMKVKGDLKVGQKVTIYYRMSATAAEAKEATEPKASKK